MKKTSSRIIFFGNESLATGEAGQPLVLTSLLDAGYKVAALVVSQKETGPSRHPSEPEAVASLARSHGIPVLSPARLSDSKNELAAYEAAAGVLVAYGKIVPQEIIDLFPRGIINLHPSLLPNRRGSAPIESIILRGDKQTGVSLMQLSAKMDAGPVYVQQKIALTGRETKHELAAQLHTLGRDLLLTHLPAILDGSLAASPQDELNATYDPRITKADSELDFTHKTAEQLEREVRAYAGWPRSRATIATSEVIITKAHTAGSDGVAGTLWLADKQLGIYCQKGVLIIDRLIPAGKKEMSAEAFLAGYRP